MSDSSRRKVVKVAGRVITAVVAVAIVVVVIDQLPDIKRYLEIREM